LLQDLDDGSFDLSFTGFDEAELEKLATWTPEDENGDARSNNTGGESLSSRFGVPPFSVLNAREGWWQERKRAWISIGIRSELGRAEKLIFSQLVQPVEVYQAKNAYEARVGRVVSWDEFYANNPDVRTQEGTSIFDPVLCELAYRRFCPPGGLVLDPFAGGSVRGIIASQLWRQYVGIAVRAKQIQAT
jgi:hypothetical protein